MKYVLSKRRNSSRKSKEVYVPVYSESALQKDEESFNQSIKSGNVDWKSFQRLMVRDICTNSKIIDTGYIGNIKLEDAQLALKHPKQGWKILLAVSDELMRISPHYFRLNSLYSNMALFCWGIDLYDVKENANITSIKKIYGTLAAKLENMNLKHEFSKIMKIIPYQDI